MTVCCCICGKEFETNRKGRKTCGAQECQHQLHISYMRQYQMPEHSKGALREYKRSYMAKRRASSKPQKEPRRDFQAEGYAERQIRKTLEMAGKIIVDV